MSQEIRKNLDVLLEHFEIEFRPALTGNFLDQPVMRQMYGESESTKFQVAQLVSSNYFMVSSHHDLSDEQIDYLGTSLRSISIKLFK